MNQVLILSFSDLASDPRVNRQIRLLAGRYRVTAAGFAHPGVPGVEFVPIPHTPRSIAGKLLGAASLKLGRFESYYWTSRDVLHAYRALEPAAFDLILANDINTLPLACRLESRHGVILDAHEYSPREYERFIWKFLFQRYNDYLCRNYLSRAAGMITVCQSIADEYRSHYGVSPAVLFNAPPYQNLEPSVTAPDTIRMIHHGMARPSRRIETMIEMMDRVDPRFHLDLMLVPGPTGYYERLRSLAAGRPRVRIVAPVPMPDMLQRLNQYDVGLYLLPPNSFNNQYALPNKFFEFIQARLAVAIGPSPEMAGLVRQHDCGVVAGDFSPRSLAERLNGLTHQQIDRFKQNSHRAARRLCFEDNATTLLDMIDRLVRRG